MDTSQALHIWHPSPSNKEKIYTKEPNFAFRFSRPHPTQSIQYLSIRCEIENFCDNIVKLPAPRNSGKHTHFLCLITIPNLSGFGLCLDRPGYHKTILVYFPLGFQATTLLSDKKKTKNNSFLWNYQVQALLRLHFSRLFCELGILNHLS